MSSSAASTLTHLECARSECAIRVDYTSAPNLCPSCGSPLLARYDLGAAARTLTLAVLRGRAQSIWRFAEVLPKAAPVSLGEGGTPLVRTRRLGAQMGLGRLDVKDEGQNPTGSFKARGLSAAVSMAKVFGIETIALPTAGNAGLAAVQWLAAAGKIGAEESVVGFNTGSGYKYLEAWQSALSV